MPEVTLPAPQFNLAVGSGIAAGGAVFIGVANEDPRILANRIDVTIIDIDGTPIVIGPSSQPFVLNSAAMITLNGSIVQARTEQDYSLALYSSEDVLLYYFPSATATDNVATTIIQMSATGIPAVIPGVGQLFTQAIGGGIQLMYMDGEGNIIQISNNGNLNVDLPNDDLTANSLFGNYFRGAVIELEEIGGEIALDWQNGQYFTYDNVNGDVDVNFSSMPLIGEGIGQTIVIAIQDAGNFSFTLIPELGYTLFVRSIDNPVILTVDGLDLIFLTVYAESQVLGVPLYDFVAI